MTDTVPIPRRQGNAETQLPFGLTYRDLARIGVPGLAGFALFGIPGLAAGAAAGLGVAKISVNGTPVDVHGWHAVQHITGTRLASWYTTADTTSDAILLENGTVYGVVAVDSVDITYLSDVETAATMATVTDFLKTVDYPAALISGQRTVDIAQATAGIDSVQAADHYVIIPAYPSEADTVAEQQELVNQRCTDAVAALTGADMDARRADLTHHHPVIERLVAEPTSIGIRGYESSDQCHRILRITEFPGEVGTAWLADILDLDTAGTVDVVQRIDPVDADDISWLRRKWQVARAEQAAAGDPEHVHAMGQVADDIQALLQAQTSGEPLLDYTVYLVVSGPSWTVVDNSIETVQRALHQHRIKARVPWFRTNRAARVVTGLTPATVGGSHVVSGQSVAAGFPWAATDTVEHGGVVFGRDTQSDRPVVLNRYDWEAGHVARIGKIGSGKSFAAKLELVRCLDQYNDLSAVVVDPKQEYGFVTDHWSDRVTRLTVDDRTADNTARLIDYVRTAYHYGHQHDGKTLVVVDEAHRLLNDAEGRKVLGQLIREGRDQAIAVTIVTQNAADFTQSREGRNILKNIDCSILMRHQDVNADVEEFFDLSHAEAARLRKLRTGTDTGFSEGIVRGPVNGVLRVEAGEREAQVIGEPDAAIPATDVPSQELSMPTPETSGDAEESRFDELFDRLRDILDTVRNDGADQSSADERAEDYSEQNDTPPDADDAQETPSGSSTVVDVLLAVFGSITLLIGLGLFPIFPLALLLIGAGVVMIGNVGNHQSETESDGGDDE